MSGLAPGFSQSRLYVERKHDEKNTTMAVDKETLASNSYCATNIGFSQPDLFKHCCFSEPPELIWTLHSPLCWQYLWHVLLLLARGCAVIWDALPCCLHRPSPHDGWAREVDSFIVDQKLWNQRKRSEGAGGMRAAMRGYGRFVYLGGQDCHGHLLPFATTSKRRGTMVLERKVSPFIAHKPPH